MGAKPPQMPDPHPSKVGLPITDKEAGAGAAWRADQVSSTPCLPGSLLAAPPAPLSLMHSSRKTCGALCGSTVSISVAGDDLGVPGGDDGEAKGTILSPLPPQTRASRLLSVLDIGVPPHMPLGKGLCYHKMCGVGVLHVPPDIILRVSGRLPHNCGRVVTSPTSPSAHPDIGPLVLFP